MNEDPHLTVIFQATALKRKSPLPKLFKTLRSRSPDSCVFVSPLTGTILGQVAAEAKAKGVSFDSSEFSYLLAQRLFSHHLELGKYDELLEIQELRDLFQPVSGDEFFVPFGDRLLELGEKQKFSRLCRTVLSIRKATINDCGGVPANIRDAQAGHVFIDPVFLSNYEATLSSMEYTLDKALLIGDQRLYEDVKEEMDLFKEGKKRQLPRPDLRRMDETLFWQLIEE